MAENEDEISNKSKFMDDEILESMCKESESKGKNLGSAFTSTSKRPNGENLSRVAQERS